jgi:cell wall assembly regulator SMI1
VTLESALSELDAALAAADPGLAATLRPGASDAALARLEKVAGALTPELTTWFRWHDGATRPRSIGPRDSYMLMRVSDVVEAWQFLRESGGRPWKPSWLPVLDNGAGDHVVCDRATGVLYRYYHDDRSRPEHAVSLAAWAQRVAAEWRRAVASEAPAPAADGWAPVEAPSRTALGKKPTGTAYYHRAAVPELGRGLFYRLYYKRGGRHSWYHATAESLAEGWAGIVADTDPRRANHDAWVAERLAAADQVFEAWFAAPPV